MNGFVLLHLAAGLTAIGLGGYQLAAAKGTPRHRALGRVYIAAMVVTCLSAFGLFRLTGQFNGLHGLAVISLITVTVGVLAARRGTQAAMRTHALCMAFSYVGLLAAAASQIAWRILPLPPGLAVPAAVALVMAGGALMVAWRMPRMLKRYA